MIWRVENKNEGHRWLSYSLLHADKAHLVGNVLIQFLCIFCVELEHGPVRTLLTFVIGSVTGSLFHSLFSCHPLVGASGGIYAMFGFCMIKLKSRHKSFTRALCNNIIVFFTFLFVVADFSYTGYYFWNCQTNTSWWCHMGGFLSGLATGTMVIDKYQEAWSDEYYPERKPLLPFNLNNCWTG